MAAPPTPTSEFLAAAAIGSHLAGHLYLSACPEDACLALTDLSRPNLVLLPQEAMRMGVGKEVYHIPPPGITP